MMYHVVSLLFKSSTIVWGDVRPLNIGVGVVDRKGLARLENGETDREPLLGEFLLECSTPA